jgi:hypothetical protein
MVWRRGWTCRAAPLTCQLEKRLCLLAIRLTDDTGESGVVSAGTNSSAIFRPYASAVKMKSIALLFVLGVIGASPYQ